MKKKGPRTGNCGGKSHGVTAEVDPKLWAPVKARRVTQADVDNAARRTEVEKQAATVANLQSQVTQLRCEASHLENRLNQTRTDIATTMLQHVEATQKFKDMTALQTQVP